MHKSQLTLVSLTSLQYSNSFILCLRSCWILWLIVQGCCQSRTPRSFLSNRIQFVLTSSLFITVIQQDYDAFTKCPSCYTNIRESNKVNSSFIKYYTQWPLFFFVFVVSEEQKDTNKYQRVNGESIVGFYWPWCWDTTHSSPVVIAEWWYELVHWTLGLCFFFY